MLAPRWPHKFCYLGNYDGDTMQIKYNLIKCRSWWRHQMETFYASLSICAGNSPVPGEFPTQRPVTRSFDILFDLRLNKRVSKQSWGWWFETLSHSLWHYRNVLCHVMTIFLQRYDACGCNIIVFHNVLLRVLSSKSFAFVQLEALFHWKPWILPHESGWVETLPYCNTNTLNLTA